MKPSYESIAPLVWAACACVLSFTQGAAAQALRLTAGDTGEEQLTAAVGSEMVVHIRAELADADVHAMAAYLTIRGGAIDILDGARATGPFQTGELASGGLLVTNELVSESDPIGAAFDGRQLDLAIVRGLDDDPMVGAGAVASFRIRCRQAGTVHIAFDQNPVRETHYLGARGVEARFVDLSGLTIHVETPHTALSQQTWGAVKRATP